MTIGYKQEFPWGGPTRFENKIKDGVKLHTIREDKTKRWRKGLKINHVVGNRTKKRRQFLVSKCTGVQEISISTHYETGIDEQTGQVVQLGPYLTVLVYDENKDPKEILGHKLERLTINDGFDSVEDFTRWFDNNDGEFFGSIIHWTDLRY